LECQYGKHVNTDNICISGCQKADDIANAFRKHYANIFVNSANEQAKVHQYNELRLNYAGSTDKDMCVTVEDIEAAIKNLKKNKAAGADHIVAEHVIYSHPCLIVLLKLLFYMMLLHGYVPNDFATGIIIPLIKINQVTYHQLRITGQ